MTETQIHRSMQLECITALCNTPSILVYVLCRGLMNVTCVLKIGTCVVNTTSVCTLFYNQSTMTEIGQLFPPMPVH